MDEPECCGTVMSVDSYDKDDDRYVYYCSICGDAISVTNDDEVWK